MSESRRIPPTPMSPTDGSSDAETLSSPPAPSEQAEPLPVAPATLYRRRKQRLLLVGAGHAHLQILDWWREQPIRGVDLTLISPFPCAAYSGMLPSVLAGLIPEHEMLVDLGGLASRCGAELVIDKAIGLDPETRTLDLAHHEERPFDVASINIGSANAREDLCQTHRTIVAVKPVATFLSRWELRLQELLNQRRDAPGPEALRFAVVGGGAAGVELALCLQERARREGWRAEIRLIEASSEILPGRAPGTIWRARALFRKRGIGVQLGAQVVDCDEEGPTELVFENGSRTRVDLVIWAAGSAPPASLRGFQLPLTSRGYLAVRPTLQTTADAPVFAVGDVAEIVGHRIPKSGVFAVRQAPVLWENLRQWFRAGEPMEYQPQRASLSLLSCGDGTAIADYNGWSLRSRWMWTLKKWIDRRFVQRFR
jgi:selenide,water dikinase